MNELSAKEQDLLERVRTKPELRPLFFRKVKGLHWFDALDQAGYFDAQHIPKPVPAREEGYVSILRWDIAEYLSKTASELTGETGSKYASRFLEVMRSATAYAVGHGFSNYQTWWKFSETLSQIPSEFVPTEFLDVVDQWFDDKYDRSLLSEQIGCKWLVKLLSEGDHSLDLATKLLEIIYKLVFIKQKTDDQTKIEVKLRPDSYYVKRITKAVSQAAGHRLGMRAVVVFQSKLEQALNETSSDRWSAIWQPAIEQHAQNEHRDKAENILVAGNRDCLIGYIRAFPEEARDHIGNLLSSNFQTMQRIAIHCITEQFAICGIHAERLLDEKFLHSNFRHEFWRFLNCRYIQLHQTQKEKLLTLISQQKRFDDSGSQLDGATAYDHATWLAAIKEFGENEANLYKAAIEIAKSEPEHPDFSSYMSVGWVEPKSPYSVEELGSLPVKELATKLSDYREKAGWQEPGTEGLSRTLKQLLKTSPTRYYPELISLSDLDLAYVHATIAAYNELWQEKANLPWEDIWPALLRYCSAVINSERFWNKDNANERESFVANRHWVVKEIGRLLEAGAKTDDHAFDHSQHEDVERIIALLLTKQDGETFRVDSDAVSIAINSPRGACLEALLNLTLRACRLADRQNSRDHLDTWRHFQHYYDEELLRAKSSGYEFSTLVTNYLPNFLYLSKQWVYENLERIFNKEDYLQWLCAVQGYAYVAAVYQDIYSFLKNQGHFLRILDDANVKEKVSEKVVQNIVVAYLNDFEELNEENSLILALIQRQDADELSQLIWFIWTLRKKEDVKLTAKVFKLWPTLINSIDLSTKVGKGLASNLCHWSVFVENLDDERKGLLMRVAPYADYSHNSYILLESLADLSKNQPFEVDEIWQKILDTSAPEYPTEAVRSFLTNLASSGEAGKRAAKNIASEYLKRGLEGPSRILREILGAQETDDA